MGNILYSSGNFIVFLTKQRYIVYNISKNYEVGHASQSTYRDAKNLARLASKKIVPIGVSTNFIESLIRISNDDNYIRRLHAKIQGGK